MYWTAKGVAVMLMFSVCVAPLAADVIPTRVADKKKDTAQTKVVERLTDMGIHEAEARAHVDSLPADALAHYAVNPHALQFVGQAGPTQGQDIFAGEGYNLWYEWVGGILAATLAIGGIFYALDNHEK